MPCNCKVCQYGTVVKSHLESLPPEQRAFFEDMYDDLIHTQLDLDHARAVIDGSWPSADDVIAHRRKVRLERTAAPAEQLEATGCGVAP